MTVLYTSANLERSDCLAREHTQQFVHRLSVVTLLERGERKREKRRCTCNNALAMWHIMQNNDNSNLYLCVKSCNIFRKSQFYLKVNTKLTLTLYTFSPSDLTYFWLTSSSPLQGSCITNLYLCFTNSQTECNGIEQKGAFAVQAHYLPCTIANVNTIVLKVTQMSK